MGDIVDGMFQDGLLDWYGEDRLLDWYGEDDEGPAPQLRCRYCGSTDVRWRQQGGHWVLFSLKPGVVHVCQPTADGFTDLGANV